MKKNAIELVFILDRSGSMSGLEADTIGGFNSMIEKQKQEAGEATVTTILFDNMVETLHDRADLQKIQPMTNKEYYVRGSTALLTRWAVPSSTSLMYIRSWARTMFLSIPWWSLQRMVWRIPVRSSPRRLSNA